MPFPFHTLDLDIAFDLMSGIVALLVSYFAFRYNRLLENSTLKFISLGFIMLGIGLLIEAFVFSFVVFDIGNLTNDRVLALLTVSLYDILQIGAYFLFAVGYMRSAFASRKMDTVGAALVALVVTTGPGRVQAMLRITRAVSAISEIFSVVFLATVVCVGLLSYSQTQHRFSLFVMLSFALILGAQIFDLVTALTISVRLDFVGSAIQFAGFLSLLIFLIWRSKIGSARKAPQ